MAAPGILLLAAPDSGGSGADDLVVAVPAVGGGEDGDRLVVRCAEWIETRPGAPSLRCLARLDAVRSEGILAWCRAVWRGEVDADAFPDGGEVVALAPSSRAFLLEPAAHGCQEGDGAGEARAAAHLPPGSPRPLLRPDGAGGDRSLPEWLCPRGEAEWSRLWSGRTVETSVGPVHLEFLGDRLRVVARSGESPAAVEVDGTALRPLAAAAHHWAPLPPAPRLVRVRWADGAPTWFGGT